MAWMKQRLTERLTERLKQRMKDRLNERMENGHTEKHRVLGASRSQHRKGLALIETAIVLPVLLLLSFGVLEYGWMFTKSGQITNAARHGARVGARADATSADVRASVASMMSRAGLGDSGYTVTISPPDVDALEPGAALAVRVQVAPYSTIGLTGFPLVPVPNSLGTEAVMAKEGP